jgi:electron transfer flavoprotein beta subunit
MKILVPFKRVPDPAAAGGDGAQWVVNPFDEIAIEEALRIRENGVADELVGVTVAPADAEEQMRVPLAMGLDRVIRIEDARTLDSYAVARILVGIVRRETPDLVLMGKQAVDDDSNQTGQMLAALLGWPQATFVSKVEWLEGNTAIQCVRETDRGLETVEMPLPAVVTADLRLNEPRYVSLPGLMKARRRPIEVVSLADLGVAVEPRTRVVGTAQAPKRKGGIKVESVEDLMNRLRTHDKVL